VAFTDTDISRAIIESYSRKLVKALSSEVLIAGAGPSGLMAAYLLAKDGYSVTLIEKRLSHGGGVWGGGMAMNDIVIQEEAKPLVDALGLRAAPYAKGVYIVDAIEFASGLALRAVQAGALILNLTVVEDVAVEGDRVTGLVVNRTFVYGSVPVDPIVLKAKVVVDGTGHDAAVVSALKKHGVMLRTPTGGAMGEGAMDAPSGEAFVPEHTGEIYPGLLVCGMAVCAAFGGPRMGPIFGGMLLSGKRIAELVRKQLPRK
jgi:thiamine thiazole synthase